MSLATFHLVFIAISILAALFAGVWGVSGYAAGDGSMPLLFGVLALLSVPVLVVYGVRVRSKLRSLPG